MEESIYDAWYNYNMAGNFFAPHNLTNDPMIVAEVEARATDRDEGHSVSERTAHNEGESEQTNCDNGAGLSQDDDKFHILELNGTLAGNVEADENDNGKGKGKEEEHANNQSSAQRKNTHAAEEGSIAPDIEEDNAQRRRVVKDNREPNTPIPQARVFTPSAASTFTPSDYDPRKFNQHAQSADHIPTFPPPPLPTVPQLATGPLSHRDGLSPFFAHPANPFTPTAPGSQACDCDWPTVAELTSEGEGRIKRWDTTTSTTTPQSCFSHPSNPSNPFHPDNADADTEDDANLPFPPDRTNTSTNTNTNTNLGRFLPLPRLRNVIDPRLDITTLPDLTLFIPPCPSSEAPYSNDKNNDKDSGISNDDRISNGNDNDTAHDNGNGTVNGKSGTTPSLPWEVRAMAGERRWDLHGARRLWEVWGWRFEDEEEGWDWLVGGGGCGCGGGGGEGGVVMGEGEGEGVGVGIGVVMALGVLGGDEEGGGDGIEKGFVKGIERGVERGVGGEEGEGESEGEDEGEGGNEDEVRSEGGGGDDDDQGEPKEEGSGGHDDGDGEAV